MQFHSECNVNSLLNYCRSIINVSKRKIESCFNKQAKVTKSEADTQTTELATNLGSKEP